VTDIVSMLSLKRVVRDGLLPSEIGKDGGKTKRVFLDFVVDGNALTERLGTEQITPFALDIGIWPGSKAHNLKTVAVEINQLVSIDRPDFQPDRWALYKCAECGDLGCGAVSVRIEKSRNQIVWKDFAFQNNWEEEIRAIPSLGPFIFDLNQYQSTIIEGLKTVEMQ
jgi:hypothetical protein